MIRKIKELAKLSRINYGGEEETMENQANTKYKTREVRRIKPMTPDEKSRLSDIAQQVRAFGEQLERFADKIGEKDAVTFARIRGMYEMAELIADLIQVDERNPKLQIIARTGSSLSELVLPHLKSYAVQVGLIAEAQELEFAKYTRDAVESEGTNNDAPAN